MTQADTTIRHPDYADAVRRLAAFMLGFTAFDAGLAYDSATGQPYAMVRVDRMGPNALMQFWRSRGPITASFSFGNQLFFVDWVNEVSAYLSAEDMSSDMQVAA